MSRDQALKLPDVWNVPFGRNPTFTGRVDELDRLRQSFERRIPRTPLQAIHGLGGIGKTQLALEYAYRFGSDYDAVWWLRAEEPATLAADLADLAVALRLHGSFEPDQRAAVEAVKQWLGHQDRWLLIFDSARDPQDLASYLPVVVPGHVLITSRHASWSSVALPLPLRGLKRADSAALLLARTGGGPAQEAPARELAGELGDLPLALAQAGAYVEEAGTSLAEYLTRFRERRADLMRRGAGDSAPTVATTWSIAFRDAQARSPAAGELLDLCSFLAPDDIPRAALRRGAVGFPPALAAAVSDPFALDEAVSALRRFSLIDVHDDALTVHRLVQAAVRDRLDDDERRAWAARAVAFVGEVFPDEPDDPYERGACRRWLPHARAALANARAAAVAPDEPAERLLRHAAVYQHRVGFDGASREMLTEALAIAEKIHGPAHEHVAMICTSLGTVLMYLHDLEGAERHARRALALDEANHGMRSAVVATDAINLAAILRECNVLDEARRLAERALRIDGALDPDSAAVARDENNLGAILRELQDFAGARRCFERAIAIDEQRRPDDLALHLNNLGLLLREMHLLREAEELAERALTIGGEMYGPDDPNVATFHSNLASVLAELGLQPQLTAEQRKALLGDARGHLERALEIGVRTYGPDHYVVAIRRNNLGALLHDLGLRKEALVQLDLAVTIARKTLRPDHPRVRKLENNRAAIMGRKPTPPPR